MVSEAPALVIKFDFGDRRDSNVMFARYIDPGPTAESVLSKILYQNEYENGMFGSVKRWTGSVPSQSDPKSKTTFMRWDVSEEGSTEGRKRHHVLQHAQVCLDQKHEVPSLC